MAYHARQAVAASVRRLGGPHAEIGIVGDLQRYPPGALGQSTLGQGLDAPNYLLAQEVLMARTRLLAENLQALQLKLSPSTSTSRIGTGPGAASRINTRRSRSKSAAG